MDGGEPKERQSADHISGYSEVEYESGPLDEKSTGGYVARRAGRTHCHMSVSGMEDANLCGDQCLSVLILKRPGAPHPSNCDSSFHAHTLSM